MELDSIFPVALVTNKENEDAAERAHRSDTTEQVSPNL